MYLHIHIALLYILSLFVGEVIKTQRDEVIGLLCAMHYAESFYLFLYLILTTTI